MNIRLGVFTSKMFKQEEGRVEQFGDGWRITDDDMDRRAAFLLAGVHGAVSALGTVICL